MTALAAHWRTISPDSLVWHGFDDAFIIFNEQTGNTHLLSPSGAAILEALLLAPNGLSLIEIQKQLQADMEPDDSRNTVESLQLLLAGLQSLGLAEMDLA